MAQQARRNRKEAIEYLHFMEESSTDEETFYVPYSLIVKKVLKINELT